MKKIIYILFTLILSFLNHSYSYASYWSLVPEGSVDTAIGDDVAYALTFHSTETFDYGMTSFELLFQFDESELEPAKLANGKYKVTYNTFGNGFGPISINNGYRSGDTYDISAGNLSDVLKIEAGNEYLFATFYMKVLTDNPWDGNADVTLLAQAGDYGIFLENFTIMQYNGVVGADVGSPAAVPVPGTGLLLGSTLLGLVGLRRKRRA